MPNKQQQAIVTRKPKPEVPGKITLRITSALGPQVEELLLAKHGFVAVDIEDAPLDAPLAILPTIWMRRCDDVSTARQIINALASEPLNIQLS